MKKGNWFGAAVALFFLFCAVMATEPQRSPSRQNDRIDYSIPPDVEARPLNDEERATVQQAINNIGSRHPSWFVWRTANGDTDTAYGALIASDLTMQLQDSSIEAETLRTGDGFVEGSVLPDGKKTTFGDQMNINDSLLRVWGRDSLVLRYLEELLVHEWRHKVQDSTQRRWGKDSIEADAWRLTKAYKDSLRMAKKDPEYENAVTMICIYMGVLRDSGIVWPPIPLDGKGITIITLEPTPEEKEERFMSFEWGDSTGYQFALAPTRASDMLIFRDYDLFPPGHHLALICGGNPQTGMAQFLGLHLSDGIVMEPPLLVEFGPPFYPPMYFHSMVKMPDQNTWFVLDTLNHQILTMSDNDENKIPDEILSIFAGAAWPGFDALAEIRGIDRAHHPALGFGLILCRPLPHRLEDLTPYDTCMFVADPNGDHIADVLLQLPFWEFVAFRPIIQAPRPWIGENHLTLYATWNHDIAVWTCDSTGQVLYEWLGAAMMSNGVDMECLLTRPLLAEDYFIAQDMNTAQRSGRPVKAIDSTPQHLVIQLRPDGMLQLNWEAVPGAGHYDIYISDDGIEFYNSGLIAETNEFLMPLPPFEKQFFYVTAVR